MKHPKTPHQAILPQIGRLIIAALCLALLFSSSLASVAFAAKITLTPDNISVSTAPGETVSVPLKAALTSPNRSNAYARFRILKIDGSLESSWVSVNDFYLTVDQPTAEESLTISVPENTSEGTYDAKFRTYLRSNDGAVPVEISLTLDVAEQQSCEPPVFSDITAQQTTFKAKNNKPFLVSFAGQVSTPEGCPLTDSWYQLSDEYGELDKNAKVLINDDGSFEASISILASRDGKDKDGRLYTVVFGAANEAGNGESGVTSIVIAHDNGKK